MSSTKLKQSKRSLPSSQDSDSHHSTESDTSNLFECKLQYCHRVFNSKKSLTIHARSCAEKESNRIRDRLLEEEARMRDQVKLTHLPEKRKAPSTSKWDDPSLQASTNKRSAVDLENQPSLFPLEPRSTNPKVQHGSQARSKRGLGGNGGAQNERAGQQAQAQPPHPVEGQKDSFKTDFHPHSRRKATFEAFEAFGQKQKEPDNQQPSNLPTYITKSNPWLPFRSRAAFEFAELTLHTALTDGEIDKLIKIVEKLVSEKDSFSVVDCQDLRQTWVAASEKRTRVFERVTLDISLGPIEQKVDFWYWDLWSCITDIVTDPLLAPHFVWDACQHSKHDGDNYVQFFDEPWTADRFWDFQSLLPDSAEAKPLGLILYADTTLLSSFGTEKGHPVILHCANLPSEIRNSDGIGGGIVVGWLPMLESIETSRNKPELANFKRLAWHECFRVLLQKLRQPSQHGKYVQCGDEIQRQLFPFIVILCSDYEEQAVMALIRGHLGHYPCPVCLVHTDSQGDIVKGQWPYRDVEKTKELVKAYRQAKSSTDIIEADKALQRQGLRGIKNAFWNVNFSDPFAALSWDRMHNYALGLGGKHILPRIIKHLRDLPGRQPAALADTQIDMLPRWQNLYHFSKALDIDFSDARKFEDLMKIILFVTHNIMYTGNSTYLEKKGMQLLLVLRSYQWLDYLASLDVHTEGTLKMITGELKTYGERLDKYIKITSEKDWNFPKNHIHLHMVRDIQQKGVTKNYNTKYNEAMHGRLKESYQFRGHFREVANYILKAEEFMDASEYIRRLINAADAIAEEKIRMEEEDASEKGKEKEKEDDKSQSKKPSQQQRAPISIANIYMGASEKPLSINDIEQKSLAIDRFMANFGVNLRKFLQGHSDFKSVASSLDQSTRITEYRFLKVFYECKVTWRKETDFLQCSPAFFNRPRYDSIMYNTGNTPGFGRLKFLFAFTIADTTYPVALIWRFTLRPRTSKFIEEKDKSLQFIRLRQLETFEFIPVRSIIRGVLLFPAFDIESDYLLFDVLDQDMGLRAKDLYNSFQ
ncbi:hypothetical protein BJ165DRAFT_1531244 [Panaeolus papilionaceus]|nr:hypothetical protein BJ165DRAFT_1531244 [Panaeolus papilionaceus]